MMLESHEFIHGSTSNQKDFEKLSYIMKNLCSPSTWQTFQSAKIMPSVSEEGDSIVISTWENVEWIQEENTWSGMIVKFLNGEFSKEEPLMPYKIVIRDKGNLKIIIR